MTAGQLLLVIWAGIIPGIILTSACIASIVASHNKARERVQRIAMGMQL